MDENEDNERRLPRLIERERSTTTPVYAYRAIFFSQHFYPFVYVFHNDYGMLYEKAANPENPLQIGYGSAGGIFAANYTY